MGSLLVMVESHAANHLLLASRLTKPVLSEATARVCQFFHTTGPIRWSTARHISFSTGSENWQRTCGILKAESVECGK